jgi:hypothetical protein
MLRILLVVHPYRLIMSSMTESGWLMPKSLVELKLKMLPSNKLLTMRVECVV